MDFIEQLPDSEGFTAILAVVDCFTKQTLFTLTHDTITVKQKRQPDWGLNPGPSRHIPDALTTELSGLTN